MSTGEILGFVAGALTTFSFLPQVVRVYRLKSAREISLPFTIALTLGGLAWLAYGILLKLYPLIVWNTITTVIVLALLAGKLRYGR